MSPAYNSTSTSVGTHTSQDRYVDDLRLNHQLPFDSSFDSYLSLSPFDEPQSHRLSTSASPAYTPGESLSECSAANYQPSELSEVEDPFFGVNFDDGVRRVDSLPSAPRFGNPAYPSTNRTNLNRPLPNLPAEAENNTAIAALSNSRYPLSPIHTSIPNTPSPRVATQDLKDSTTISQHELTTELHNSRFRTSNYSAPTHSSLQLTPDRSGSSRASEEGFGPSSMPLPEQSPRVTISQWPSVRNTFDESGEQFGLMNDPNFGAQMPSYTSGIPSGHSIQRNDQGGWRSNATGQAGLDPETRREMSDAQVPTLDEHEERRRIAHKNLEVDEWRSQAGSDVGDEQPGQSYFSLNNRFWGQPKDGEAGAARQERENNIQPLDDGASVHENRLVEGQAYYDFINPQINETDRDILSQPRQWHDAPSMPYTMSTTYQPKTANEAMMKFNRNAETISIASRAATWGTRRKSEPSLAGWEGVTDGSFLKKLSISKDRDRPRQNSLFDQGLDRLASIVRKRSESRLKRARSTQNIPEETTQPSRHNSQGSLAIPGRASSFAKKPTPSINTAFAAITGQVAAVGSTHARHGSVSNVVSSPKSPKVASPNHLSFPKFMTRARSKSEISAQDKQAGLAGLWRQNGGPPLPTLATPPATHEVNKPIRAQPKLADDDDDDEEDDDQAEENDTNLDSGQEADPIVPDYEGFKAHVRRLNPNMDPQHKWLVSRIAHQQEIRYKSLLDMRVKHIQAIGARNCSAGPHCLSFGGAVVLTDARGILREPDRNPAGLQVVTDFNSDDDSNHGEGALTDETFPPGVPMPPTRILPAEFECQLCFKAKRFRKPSDWTKHVHEDVQPFTCTYDKCKEPKSFKRKADWVRHENERHRHLEWWICKYDDCRHPCYRKDNFLQHLVREHKLPEPKQKTKAAIKKARLTEPVWMMLEQCHHETQNRPQDEPCKFCGKSFPTWKKLTVHLAKHMEHISLPVLRLVEAQTVDANTIVSPVEQNMSPLTPIDRAEMEIGTPFNMDSISPHVPMTSQFSTNYEQPSTYFRNSGQLPAYNMQTSMPQEVHYNQDMYSSSNLGVQPISQPRGFNTLGSLNMSHIDQVRQFGSMDADFAEPKVDQHTRALGSLDSGFAHTMPNQDFNTVSSSGYSMPQTFSAAPAVSGYQPPDMLGISDDGFDFDPLAVNAGQNFQQVPMSRTRGSASSYGHSPQNIPFYGQQ